MGGGEERKKRKKKRERERENSSLVRVAKLLGIRSEDLQLPGSKFLAGRAGEREEEEEDAPSAAVVVTMV